MRFSCERSFVKTSHYTCPHVLDSNEQNLEEMKLLQCGRSTLVWLGVQFADDGPINWQLKLARKAFAIAYAIIYVGFSAVHVQSFVSVRFSNVEEFFFILSQFTMTIQSSSAFITVYVFNSRLTRVFQSLTQIHKKCKRNDKFYRRS